MRKSNPRNPRGRFGVLREHSASRSVRGQEARAEIDDALARMEAEEAEARKLDCQLLEEAKSYGLLELRPLDEGDDLYNEEPLDESLPPYVEED